jgi:hypothetical protein
MLAVCHAHLEQFAEAREAAVKFQATAGRDVRDWAERVGGGFMKSRLARMDFDT